jgi:hypothetical protein
MQKERKGAASVKGRYMMPFPKLIQRIEQLNRELFDFDDLVYLCENVPMLRMMDLGSINLNVMPRPGDLVLSKRIFYFNWIPEFYPEEDLPAGGTNDAHHV